MKQKIKVLVFGLLSLSISGIFAGHALANGSATLWWTAPTTNEGSASDANDLTDLAGYRIFYSTATIDCTAWNAATDQTTRVAAAMVTAPATVAHYDVAEGATLRDSSDTEKRGFTFNNTNLLTPGASYNFVVVAYDTSNNYSKCSTSASSPDGSASVPKATISYAADIATTGPSFHKVDLFDYNLFFPQFGSTTPGNIADFDKNGVVNLFDYNILFGDFGASF